ncbi:beta-alanine synthase [Xylariales sp. PMI_506]|nr:beta-alanine synthase [Xylariales sp. PMI_506]
MRAQVISRSLSHPWRRLYSTGTPPAALRINADRLMETLHHTCQWGADHRYGNGPTETGMRRLALSEEDVQVRRWFADEMKKLDCTVALDKMGNMFAKRQGSLQSAAPMTAMGSHLDTQPRGGRYDGILGVIAAVEVMRTLHENGKRTRYDVGVVNWTNEEGARFPKSMVSSGVWAGVIPLSDGLALADISDSSVSMLDELKKHNLQGSLECSSDPSTGFPLGAHFELHIEQGPILEQSGKQIGVVQGSQSYRWFTFTVTGRDAHTGTTPLSARSDPVLAAAKMIAASNDVAKTHGGLASTGIIKMPSLTSTNTIASQVTFTLDIRHPSDETVKKMQDTIIQKFKSIARDDGRGVGVEWTIDTTSDAAIFDKGCIAAVENAANKVVGQDGWLPITSGAGHDSVYTSLRCPTSMIFVPCKDGVSHHPEEYCSPTDCANGAQVLLESILDYDLKRKD